MAYKSLKGVLGDRNQVKDVKVKNADYYHTDPSYYSGEDPNNKASKSKYFCLCFKHKTVAPEEKVGDEEEEHPITDKYSFWAHGQKHYYSSNSLGFLSNKNAIRKALVTLVTWVYFEYFITIMILLNSAFLGMKDY
jgi:hypothetical protein